MTSYIKNYSNGTRLYEWDGRYLRACSEGLRFIEWDGLYIVLCADGRKLFEFNGHSFRRCNDGHLLYELESNRIKQCDDGRILLECDGQYVKQSSTGLRILEIEGIIPPAVLIAVATESIPSEQSHNPLNKVANKINDSDNSTFAKAVGLSLASSIIGALLSGNKSENKLEPQSGGRGCLGCLAWIILGILIFIIIDIFGPNDEKKTIPDKTIQAPISAPPVVPSVLPDKPAEAPKPVTKIVEPNWDNRYQHWKQQYLSEFKKPVPQKRSVTIGMKNGSQMSGVIQSVTDSSLTIKIGSGAIVTLTKEQLSDTIRPFCFADDYANLNATKKVAEEKEQWQKENSLRSEPTRVEQKQRNTSSLPSIDVSGLDPLFKQRLEDRRKEIAKTLNLDKNNTGNLQSIIYSINHYIDLDPDPTRKGWEKYKRQEIAFKKAIEAEIARREVGGLTPDL